MEILKCKNLTVGYDSKIIHRGISFEVHQGDYLCIVGENGAGKSTLVKTLLGLVPKLDGEIEFKNGLKQNEIGYLPQQTMVQRDFPASVKEIVLSGCQGKGSFKPFYTKADKALADKNIERMGISDLKNRCYRELSGGQQQRVLLARALCATQKLILLDEPAAGLDPKVTADMYSLIESLNKEDNTAVIMISHDIPATLKYSTHILHIGDKILFAKTEDYVKSGIGKRFIQNEGGAEND